MSPLLASSSLRVENGINLLICQEPKMRMERKLYQNDIFSSLLHIKID